MVNVQVAVPQTIFHTPDVVPVAKVNACPVAVPPPAAIVVVAGAAVMYCERFKYPAPASVEVETVV